MSKHTSRFRTGNDRASLYTEITNKVIAELEADRIPWVQPWGTPAIKAPLAMPRNAATRREYSGINVMILWGAVIEHGFSGQSWLTFRQVLGHWTGHASRLKRDHSGSFGSKSYAREELVAEMVGAFVCASLGIVPTVRHADYVGYWPEVLREDNRAVVRAASAASTAADSLLGFLTQVVDTVAASNEEAA
jgi:antirestriction protein ArdC